MPDIKCKLKQIPDIDFVKQAILYPVSVCYCVPIQAKRLIFAQVKRICYNGHLKEGGSLWKLQKAGNIKK